VLLAGVDIGVHTGPVIVEFALLVHVPTSSAGMAAVWACAPRIAAPESSSAAIRDNMVGLMRVCERVWMVGDVQKRAWVREGVRVVSRAVLVVEERMFGHV
jgi:hypothetical protein